MIALNRPLPQNPPEVTLQWPTSAVLLADLASAFGWQTTPWHSPCRYSTPQGLDHLSIKQTNDLFQSYTKMQAAALAVSHSAESHREAKLFTFALEAELPQGCVGRDQCL
jgi:hypothetical protein